MMARNGPWRDKKMYGRMPVSFKKIQSNCG